MANTLYAVKKIYEKKGSSTKGKKINTEDRDESMGGNRWESTGKQQVGKERWEEMKTTGGKG